MREPFVQDADFTLYVGDVREVLRELKDESVHCVVTSPPYWGLRDYGSEGQIGLEATPDEYVAALVEVFREVRRVLRRDGTCWLNLGDSYNGSGGAGGDYADGGLREGQPKYGRKDATTLKPKDLVGIPWRVAFALQADGWYLRSDIIWAKPNPMPESVTDRPTKAHEYLFLLTRSARYFYDADAIREPAEWARWGDQTNGKHEGSESAAGWIGNKSKAQLQGGRQARRYTAERFKTTDERNTRFQRPNPVDGGRNARSVWEIATQPYAEAHFATFPEELPRRCIAAGTSERGCCPECGAPWKRETEIEYVKSPKHGKGSIVGSRNATSDTTHLTGGMANKEGLHEKPRVNKNITTTGWTPTCECGDEQGVIGQVGTVAYAPIPCTILDLFMGSGTTALVARKLGRKSIGIELNPDYAELAARRLSQQSLLA